MCAITTRRPDSMRIHKICSKCDIFKIEHIKPIYLVFGVVITAVCAFGAILKQYFLVESEYK